MGELGEAPVGIQESVNNTPKQVVDQGSREEPSSITPQIEEQSAQGARIRLAYVRNLIKGLRRTPNSNDNIIQFPEAEIEKTEEKAKEPSNEETAENLQLEPSKEAPVPIDETAKDKELLDEIVHQVLHFGELKPEEIEELESQDILGLYQRRKEAIDQVNSVNIIGRGSRLTPREKLTDHVKRSENIARLRILDTVLRKKAYEMAGVTSEKEFEKLWTSGGYTEQEIFYTKGVDRDIVWESMARLLPEGVFTEFPELRETKGEGYMISFWQNPEDFGPEARLELMRSIQQKAIELKRPQLARKARIMYARDLNILSQPEGEHFLKYTQKLIDDRGVRELVHGARNLARDIDHKNGSEEQMEDLARKFGIDKSALSIVSEVDSGGRFLDDVLKNNLAVGFQNYPDLFKNIVREFFARTDMFRLINAYPIDQAANNLGKIAEAMSLDPSIAESLSPQIEEFELFSQHPKFFSYIKEGDYNFTILAQRVMRSPNPGGILTRLESILDRGDEADFVWEYTKLSFSQDALQFQLPDVQISRVPGIPQSLQWENLSKADKERLTLVDSEDELNGPTFSLENLSNLGKAVITRAVLREVVERSKSDASKNDADERNRQLADQADLPLREGDLLHGTNIDFLRAIFHTGDRAGEFLGFDSKKDATPFAADFSEVLDTDVKGEFQYANPGGLQTSGLAELFQDSPFEAIYAASIASQYGAKIEGGHVSSDAKSNQDTGITLIFSRQQSDAFLKGSEYGGHMRDHHKLILVGLPSTEISGIIVNKDSAETIERARGDIVENGFYIPIYDTKGNLIFSQVEYDSMRSSKVLQDLNKAA
jgi:hypothetical protein